MDEEIIPVQPIGRIKKVSSSEPVSLFKRLRPNPRPNNSSAEQQPGAGTGGKKENKAHQNPEHVGEQVDINV